MSNRNKGKQKRGASARQNSSPPAKPAQSRGTRERSERKKKPSGPNLLMKRIRLMASVLKKELKKSTKSGYFPIVSIAAVVIVLFFGSFYLLTNKNAYNVMVGETTVATIKKDKNITAEKLTEEAVQKIETDLGTSIQIKESVTFQPVHATGKEMQSPDVAIIKISDELTYTVEAILIRVEGTEMAKLNNQREADELKNRIVSQYILDGAELVESETDFVEDYRTEIVYVDPSEITTVDNAYDILTRTTKSAETYVIKAGDSLTSIAYEAKMTVEQLLTLNPSYNINSTLNIGEELLLQVDKPLLSVITVQETVQTVPVEKTYEYQVNDAMPATHSKVIQYGSDGQAEVTIHIIRVNGHETERREINKTITVPPVTEIIETGPR